MQRTDLIKLLGFVLALQLLFTTLRYFGFDASPALMGGLAAGVLTMYLGRKRRK
jgi:hypothetical protein